MYDKKLETDWHLDISFDEDDTHTHATVRAELGDGETMTALGDAFRNPKDVSQPMIGEEIAAARALIALGTDLLHRAGARIEAVRAGGSRGLGPRRAGGGCRACAHTPTAVTCRTCRMPYCADGIRTRCPRPSIP